MIWTLVGPGSHLAWEDEISTESVIFTGVLTEEKWSDIDEQNCLHDVKDAMFFVFCSYSEEVKIYDIVETDDSRISICLRSLRGLHESVDLHLQVAE